MVDWFLALTGVVVEIAMIVRSIIIIKNSDVIRGTATDRGNGYFSEYTYEYDGKKYTAWAASLPFRRKGRKYFLWVNRDNPRKIESIEHLLFMIFSIFVFFGNIEILIKEFPLYFL